MSRKVKEKEPVRCIAYLFVFNHDRYVESYEKKKRKSHILITGKVDDALKDKFPDSEICGRFIIHPGETDWQTHISGKEVAVVNQDEHLYKYYNFDKLKEIVQKKTPDVHKKNLDKVLFCLKELSHESIDI